MIGPVGVQVVDGVVEQRPGVGGVVDLDVAPAAELAPVVDGRAPLVAGGVGLGGGGAGGLAAARHLDDQGALHVVRLGDEAHQEVGHVLVGPPLVHVGDREPEPLVLHVRLDARVVLQGLGEAFFPGVAAQRRRARRG